MHAVESLGAFFIAKGGGVYALMQQWNSEGTVFLPREYSIKNKGGKTMEEETKLAPKLELIRAMGKAHSC